MMEEKKDKYQEEEANEGKQAFNNYARYSGLAFQMVVIIGLFTFAGYSIDKKEAIGNSFIYRFAKPGRRMHIALSRYPFH